MIIKTLQSFKYSENGFFIREAEADQVIDIKDETLVSSLIKSKLVEEVKKITKGEQKEIDKAAKKEAARLEAERKRDEKEWPSDEEDEVTKDYTERALKAIGKEKELILS